jgi:hypothetical protein
MPNNRRIVAGLAAAGLLLASAALAADATVGLTGTWNVVAKPGAVNTCGSPVENSAYQWILTQNGTSVEVAVQGSTGTPQLAGAISGKRLALEGSSTQPLGSGFAGVFASSVFQLSVSGKNFKGSRYYLGSRPRPGGGTVLCMIEFDVTGSKQ